MKSVTTVRFRNCFDPLPENVKSAARKAYEHWKNNPAHPSLQFKVVNQQNSIYSVRVSLSYRALGVKTGDTLIWFWIGSHAQYDELLKSL
jgi:hypothetical protein